jgi:hypothetical protein
LWQALQQTDAGGSEGSSFELPPSYEEVIAGISSADNGPTLSPPPQFQLASAPALPEHGWDLAGRQIIHIRRPTQEPSCGYGFAFRDGRVTVVLPNSAAQLAGLAEGSRLIEVNGLNVGSQNKNFICQCIQQNPESVSLLVEPPSKCQHQHRSLLHYANRTKVIVLSREGSQCSAAQLHSSKASARLRVCIPRSAHFCSIT